MNISIGQSILVHWKIKILIDLSILYQCKLVNINSKTYKGRVNKYNRE